MKKQLKQTAYIFLTALILCTMSCSDNISGKLALPENEDKALQQPKPPQKPSNPPKAHPVPKQKNKNFLNAF